MSVNSLTRLRCELQTLEKTVTHHRCFASQEVEQLLSANGLADLNSAFELGEPLGDLHEGRASRHEYKRVVKLDLAAPDGVTRVYIKRQWRRERWLPRPTDIRHRIRLKCSPVHEWRGLRLLQGAGFCVAEPLALFWQGWGFSRGAVVTRAVPPQYSLADLIQIGELDAMAPQRRISLIEASAKLIARLHRARISWRSMKAKHFYPEETSPCNWRIWLIDCEGVYNRATRRDCQREWGVFLRFVTPRMHDLRKAFLAAYSAGLNL
jgi:hypothetical protein